MQYQVKTLSRSSEVGWLLLDAADELEAARQAKSMGHTVLAATPYRAWSLRALKSRRGSFPLLLFSQELLVLLDAGLPLIESLEALGEKEQNRSAKHVIAELCSSLREGRTFSAALERQPEVFPPIYVATARASEKTGDLREALSRYVSYRSRLDIVRNKIVTASMYPLLLLGAGGLVCLFLMFYVVPRFSGIYEELGGNLPLLSVWLLKWGQLIDKHGEAVVAVLIAALAGLVYLVRRGGLRRWVSARLWALPAVGMRLRTYHLARFYRMTGMLVRGGTPVVQALEMAAGLLHPRLREPLEQATRRISEGAGLTTSLEQHHLTTPVALRMLAVGERSGALGEMMERIAVFHDEEITRWADWFTRLFEPILMALIGLAIGTIVILMYLPIFELAGSIQ
jgi:general secretion pathway protein F